MARTIMQVDADELRAVLAPLVAEGVAQALAANAAPTSEWLSADEVAVLTGYNRRTVPGLVRLHGLPCHPVGRKLRFRRVEVERWVRDRGPR